MLTADGTIRVDRHASGRGAWLCGAECIVPARRRRAFDRAWRTPVRPAAIDRLDADLSADSSNAWGAKIG